MSRPGPGGTNRFLVKEPAFARVVSPLLSIERKRTETVYRVVRELVQQGRRDFRAGDVCAALRARNQPMGAWLVRAEFRALEQHALVELDAETGDWRLTGNEMPAADAGPLSDMD